MVIEAVIPLSTAAFHLISTSVASKLTLWLRKMKDCLQLRALLLDLREFKTFPTLPSDY